jgi:hypothetical protein
MTDRDALGEPDVFCSEQSLRLFVARQSMPSEFKDKSREIAMLLVYSKSREGAIPLYTAAQALALADAEVAREREACASAVSMAMDQRRAPKPWVSLAVKTIRARGQGEHNG